MHMQTEKLLNEKKILNESKLSEDFWMRLKFLNEMLKFI